MGGLDDKVVVKFNRLSGFIGGDHALMHFFAGANPDDFGFTFRRNGAGDVHDGCAGDFGDKDFSAFHLFERQCYEIDSLLKRDDEPSHGWVGNGKRA